MKNRYKYTHQLHWSGDLLLDSNQNDRLFEIEIDNKGIIYGSADKPFFGDPNRLNPEDMLLAALSSCHMMSFMYLCRKEKIKVLSYSDKPIGELKLNVDGSGQFEIVTLYPKIKVDSELDENKLMELHQGAGKLCFIANSCNFDIVYQPSSF